MKTSFRKLTIRPTLSGEPEVNDLTDLVADIVYQTAMNFAQHTLAHRIAESGEDGIDLTEEDTKTIKAALDQTNLRFFVKKPILEAIGEKFE